MIAPLFRLEVRHLARQKIGWGIVALLFSAMVVACAAGAARVRAEEATLTRVAIEEHRSIERVKSVTRAWSRPGDLTVPVFRDPTDAYSYFYNFLVAHAVRSPAPLAAVAAGQSDLQPAYIRLNMNAVFPDTAYELRSPRILALGAFDLAFVLIYLLPLGVIAVAGTSLAREQDSGILRLIAAQPVRPRTVAAARFGAHAALLVPSMTASALLAVLVTGAASTGSGTGLLLLAGLAALYIIFWVALCALVASFWLGSVQALATLMLVWAGMTVLLPAAGALLIDALMPAPSRLAYIDRSRALADEVPSGWEDRDGAERWLASRPDLPVRAEAAASADVGRLARDAFFRAELAPQRSAFEAHGRAVDRAGRLIRLLSPASMLDGSLQALSGTDAAAQAAFAIRADEYAQTLRRHFEPLIVANVGRAPRCGTCPGRLNFAAYDAVPAFSPTPTNTSADEASLLAFLYLAAATLVVGGLAAHRFRRWPE